MKKTFLLALAGMMLFAFTQCGGGESKEFKDFKKAISEFESQLKSAKSCDDLIKAEAVFDDSDWAINNYSEKDKMTDAEEGKAREMLEKAGELYDKREEELCSDFEDLIDGLKDNLDEAIDDWGDVVDDLGDGFDDAMDDLDDALDDLNDALDDWSESMEDLFE